MIFAYGFLNGILTVKKGYRTA